MNDDLLRSIKARQNRPAHRDDAVADRVDPRQAPPRRTSQAGGVARVHQAGSRPAARKRSGMGRSLPSLLLLFGLGSLVIVIAAGSAVANPVLASIVSLEAMPAPTHAQSFAQVWIAKPTYTSLSANTPTATLPPPAGPAELFVPPNETAALPLQGTDSSDSTSTPGAIYAEIVADTPTLEYVLPSIDQTTSSSDQTNASFYGGNQYILIDISEQHLYAYGNDGLVYSFVASTGMNNATAAGHFSVLDKIPNAYGATWDIWMPNWLGIYWAGGLENGIHALPILSNGATLWAGFLGRPISYGCIVLGSYEAQLLYDWAEIGTPVDIQW